MNKSIFFNLGLILSALMINGCGSSSSDSPGASTINGSIFASYVDGATVGVTDKDGTYVAGPVITESDGTYTISIPNSALAGDLVFSSDSGTFDDEATGGVDTTAAGPMAAYVPGGILSSGGSVNVTPSSTIISGIVASGKTFSEAEDTFFTAFGYTPDISVTPVDATATPPAGATDEQIVAGRRAAAFSTLADTLTINPEDQFDLFAAIALDLSDGTIDGSGAIGSTGETLSSTVTDDFEGALFSKTVKTDTYQIVYVPGMMGAMEGKTTFKLSIADAATGLIGQEGLTVSLMPMMHMSTMNHGTPAEGCTEIGGGDYSCTLYYLMGSGGNMGWWDLEVFIGGMMDGESAHFYPSVMMAMGDTKKAKLKGQADKIPNMMGMMASRDYYIFNDGAFTNTSSFDLFIATKASMMSFPAISTDTVLNSGTDYELTASSVSVQVSSDSGNSWSSATDNGDGHWTASDLTFDNASTVYVELAINGEQKTTNGAIPDEAAEIASTNEYAAFSVTPGTK